MANDLQQTRYDQLVRRVGGIIGPGSKVAEALPELFPMINVEDPPAELLMLGGSRLCMGRVELAAGGAGNFVQVLLRNPAGSGQLARIVQVSVLVTTAQEIVCGPTLNSLAAVGTTAFADLRLFPQVPSMVTQGVNTGLVAGSTFFSFDTQNNAVNVWEPPVACGVIVPGTAFGVGSNVSNLAATISFLWVERTALESELLFP